MKSTSAPDLSSIEERQFSSATILPAKREYGESDGKNIGRVRNMPAY